MSGEQETEYEGYRRPYGRKSYVVYPQPYLPTGKPVVRNVSENPPPHHRQVVVERPPTEVRRPQDTCPGGTRIEEEVRVTKETLSDWRNYDIEKYPWHLVPKEGSPNLYARNVINVPPDGLEYVVLDVQTQEHWLLQITRFGHTWWDNMIYTIYSDEEPVLQFDFQFGEIDDPFKFDTPESMNRFTLTARNMGVQAHPVECLIAGWREPAITQVGSTRFAGFLLGPGNANPGGTY